MRDRAENNPLLQPNDCPSNGRLGKQYGSFFKNEPYEGICAIFGLSIGLLAESVVATRVELVTKGL